MKQALVVSLFLGILACGTYAGAAEKIVVEKSPFAEAHFILSSSINGFSGSLANAYTILDLAQDEARNYETPHLILLVSFKKVIKDTNSMELNNQNVLVLWDDIKFAVDPTQKGMSLSFERQRNSYGDYATFKNVIITVPSKHDELLWTIRAERLHAAYLTAFWEERYRREIVEKEEAKLLKILGRGPIMVFPED
ncbi:hypothetical protein KGQ34_02040 [Patescibacteria group bacterium]|nr:hypothetical protein [Patescibacteria group bacterium]